MLTTRVFNKLLKCYKPNACLCSVHNALNRRWKSNDSSDEKLSSKKTPLGEMRTKYQIFDDKDSEIILDVYEERLKYSNLLEETEEEDSFEGINLERGKTGVFDIEDLVDVLKRENGEDIFVAKVPKDIKYVDYICIVNGKSQRHMSAIVQFVRRVYKQKRHKGDIIPKLEGNGSKDWIALDLGNIALHIFSKEARKVYDLDSLWALGPQYDDEYNKPEPVSDMLEKHSIYLSGLEPASNCLQNVNKRNGQSKGKCREKTLLGYELTSHQDAIINHLLPSISACVLYIFLIAGDAAVIFSHFKNGDPIWGSITCFCMYLPVLGSFIIIVSNWELWPEFEGCGRKNVVWFGVKVAEHLFFPVWSMWRFAERIFWSIEAVRAKDENSIKEALSVITAPRSIELYIFLQSYIHSLPQILLQLYILMRHNTDINRQTEKAQILSIVLNLAKVSVTTTYYQRFRSQKLTGKQYPWYKHYKSYSQPSSQSEVILRRSNFSENRLVIEERRNTSNLEDNYDLEPPRYSERRRSSDIYLEPTTSRETSNRQTLLETDFDEEIKTKEKVLDGVDEPDQPLTVNKALTTTTRETSVTDGPRRVVYRETGISERTEPDFNIPRVIYVKGLEDDDLAGKLIAFFWWFSFLLARVLAISVFAYFFMKETLWLLCSHFILVMAFLLYDVKSDAVKRAKAIFFLFIGLIYIFCIIEFKIKFKKATFIYYGFFILVFVENFVMCMTWYSEKIESIENDFWFRYIFYIVVTCTITSFSSMVFYFTINKPPKVVVEAKTQN